MAQQRHTETALHMAVVRWARQMAEVYPCLRWLYHAANGGKCDPREAGKRQSMGVLAGVPDLFLPARSGPYAGLYIELKKKPNRPTPEQRAFFDYVETQGYKTAVAYTLEDAQAIISGYLNGQPVGAAE